MSSTPTFAYLIFAAIGSLGAVMAVLGMLWASGQASKKRRYQRANIADNSMSQSKTDLAL